MVGCFSFAPLRDVPSLAWAKFRAGDDMLSLFFKAFLLVCLLILAACDKPETFRQVLEKHLWHDNVLLVFSPDKENAEFDKALTDMMHHRATADAERLVYYDTVEGHHVRRNMQVLPHIPAAQAREVFDVPATAFTVILLGRNGEEKFRSTEWPGASALWKILDATPETENSQTLPTGKKSESPAKSAQ